MRKVLMSIIVFLFILKWGTAQTKASFSIIPLGVKGGADESNLSAYLLAANNDTSYICLDAGTVYNGLQVAHHKRTIKKNLPAFFKENIKAYFISHGHLDHLAGLILNAPNDSKKPIYALPFCIDVLKTKYFTWSSWANFANEGEKPALGTYSYQYLKKGIEAPIEKTNLFVTPFLLSHATPGKSTAFLIRHNNAYFLYLGDTGDDEIEHSDNLKKLWQGIAPLVAKHRLKGIAIECSFTNEQANNKLFGHLKPTLLFKNLQYLDSLSGYNAMRNLPILITHIKPISKNKKIIEEELKQANNIGVRLIFPKQGKKIIL